MGKDERRLAVLVYLDEHPGSTTADIFRACGMDRRVLLNDLIALGLAGKVRRSARENWRGVRRFWAVRDFDAWQHRGPDAINARMERALEQGQKKQ